MPELQTLVLTSRMSPHRIVSWQESICLQFTGKVDVLEIYEVKVSSPSMTLDVPAVVRLKREISAHKKGIKFSRLNVLTRDHFTCLYCGQPKSMGDLNYDHVIPRAQGGKTTWENIVTSCYPCNKRKGNRTPAQAGMRLLRKPYRPKLLPMTQPLVSLRDFPPIWIDYLPRSFAQAG